MKFPVIHQFGRRLHISNHSSSRQIARIYLENPKRYVTVPESRWKRLPSNLQRLIYIGIVGNRASRALQNARRSFIQYRQLGWNFRSVQHEIFLTYHFKLKMATLKKWHMWRKYGRLLSDGSIVNVCSSSTRRCAIPGVFLRILNGAGQSMLIGSASNKLDGQ